MQRQELELIRDRRREQRYQDSQSEVPPVSFDRYCGDEEHRGQEYRGPCQHRGGHAERVQVGHRPLCQEQEGPPAPGGREGEGQAERFRAAGGPGEKHHPEPARTIHTQSNSLRDPRTATASGPRNSIVTTMPSGVRLIAS